MGSSRMTEVGVVNERLRKADPLPHALGVFLEDALLVGGQADHVDEFGGPLLARVRVDVEQPAVEVERLLGVEEAVQVRLFRQESDALVLLDLRRRFAEHERVA